MEKDLERAFQRSILELSAHADTVFQERERFYQLWTETDHALRAARQQLDTAVEEAHALRGQLTRLEEEHRDFRKVSQLIALEKENSQLKEELRLLMKRLHVVQPPAPTQTAGPAPVPAPEPLPDPEAWQEEAATSALDLEPSMLQTKKIKGVSYYVHPELRDVYEKGEDGSVGACVGVLEQTAEGKLKMVWGAVACRDL